jgi:hypothetical protein
VTRAKDAWFAIRLRYSVASVIQKLSFSEEGAFKVLNPKRVLAIDPAT